MHVMFRFQTYKRDFPLCLDEVEIVCSNCQYNFHVMMHNLGIFEWNEKCEGFIYYSTINTDEKRIYWDKHGFFSKCMTELYRYNK